LTRKSPISFEDSLIINIQDLNAKSF